MKYSSSPRPVWATELALMFALGFILASTLWLSLWFFRAQPSQAAAVDEKESALAACQRERQVVREELAQVRAKYDQADRKLREAQIGWGRCLREKSAPPVTAGEGGAPP